MKKILIVEDDELFRLSLERILTAEDNYKIYSVGTGEEALKIIEDGSVDLILLDLKLPGIHGLEVLQQIRKFGKAILVNKVLKRAWNGDKNFCNYELFDW